MNEQYSKDRTPKNVDLSSAIDKLLEGGDRKMIKKKKCKTQGEESIEKLLTESGKAICGNLPSKQSKWKKENQSPSQLKLTTEMSKTTLTFKKDLSNLKMKRIAEKLSELTNQEKKRGRIKETN